MNIPSWYILYMEDLTDQIQFINVEGKKAFAVLPLEIFEEIFEDFVDLKAIEERKNEPTVTLDDLKEELKSDGKLQS